MKDGKPHALADSKGRIIYELNANNRGKTT